ncbi:MAG: VOC family protein, partial [Pseudomonadota bacterium]
ATLVRKPLLRADGSLWNAEIDIGGSTIMLAAPDPAAPMTQTAFVYVQVEDADATFQRAIEAGATAMMAPQDQFYGDRDGGVQDLSGNIWWISTHKDDLSDDEIERGARALEAQKAGEA